MLEKIKSSDTTHNFSKDLRDLLRLDRGPFSCCHTFIDIEKADTATKLINLTYESPIAQLLRDKARKKVGIFHEPGRTVQVGVFDGHARGIAASCRKAQHFNGTVQIFSKDQFIIVQVVKSFDCDREDFEWRENPNLFVQIGLDDAHRLFGNRQFFRSEPAKIITAPSGWGAQLPVELPVTSQ